MKIFATDGYTLSYLVPQFEKFEIISERDAARFDGPLSPEYIEVPEEKEQDAHFLLKCINTEIYHFRIENAPETTESSRKTMFPQDWDACLR